MTSFAGKAYPQEKLLGRVAERQGRRGGVARPVFFSRRGGAGCALSLHGRRGLEELTRFRRDDQAYGGRAGRSAAATIPASKMCCCELFAHPSLTAKRISKRSPTPFSTRYDGDRKRCWPRRAIRALSLPSRDNEQKLAQAEMELLVEVGQIPRTAPISTLFAP